MRVLIFEDDPIIALPLSRRVLEAGHEVSAWVLTAEDALAQAEQRAPDLVIVDPERDGFASAAEAIRAIRRDTGVQVAFIAGKAYAPTEYATDLQPLATLDRDIDDLQVSNLLDIAAGLIDK